jgi:hypothetical protein
MNSAKPAVLLIAALLLPASARANLRAPVEVHRSPSSSLYRAGAALVVKGEDLRFNCGRQTCAVQAVYHVRAHAAVKVPLEFICPGKNTLTVKVGAAPATVTSVALPAAERKKIEAGMGFSRTRPDLHKARFVAQLRAGANRIQISYAQKLSALERDYGYFKKGRFVHRLQYELWPLKGWKLAPDFRLDLQVKLLRKAPSWWTRTFGTVKAMTCGKQGKGKAITVKPKQQGAYLVLAARMGKEFPDRLTCRFGDKDLL